MPGKPSIRRHDADWLARELTSATTLPLDRRALTELLRRLHRVEIPRSTVLYKKNAVPDAIWILRTGHVELSDGSGSDRTVIGVMNPGDILGDLYVILDEEAPLDARAIEDCVLLCMPSSSFKEVLAQHPSLAAAWLSSFARRLSGSRTRVMEVLARSLPERVARLLSEQSVDGRLSLSQRTIAQMLGADRSSINRVLKEFESDGLLEIGYRTLELKDRDGLLNRARTRADRT